MLPCLAVHCAFAWWWDWDCDGEYLRWRKQQDLVNDRLGLFPQCLLLLYNWMHAHGVQLQSSSPFMEANQLKIPFLACSLSMLTNPQWHGLFPKINLQMLTASFPSCNMLYTIPVQPDPSSQEHVFNSWIMRRVTKGHRNKLKAFKPNMLVINIRLNHWQLYHINTYITSHPCSIAISTWESLFGNLEWL